MGFGSYLMEDMLDEKRSWPAPPHWGTTAEQMILEGTGWLDAYIPKSREASG